MNKRHWRTMHGTLTFTLAMAINACNSVVPQAARAPVPVQPHLSISMNALAKNLADKRNLSWQDGVTNQMPAVRTALRARGPRQHRSLDAVGQVWSLGLTTASSSAPAYLYSVVDVDNATSPLPGDFLYVVQDNGTVEKIDPATKAATTVSLGQTVSKSAVGLSNDNKRLYVATTTGYLFILNASTLATMWSAKISSTGFTGQSPFVDFGLNDSGGDSIFGSMEHVMLMSADGSLYDVYADQSTGTLATTVHAWTSSNGTDKNTTLPSWNTHGNVPYGAAMAPGSSPIWWQGTAYVGTTAGTFYALTVNPASGGSAASVKSWNLAQFTSAPSGGRGCSAPPALDYDNAGNVSAIFAPCGDRLCWIDPASGRVYDSPPLVVDHKPSALQSYGKLDNFPYNSTSTTKFTVADWEGVAAINPPTPSRWGNGGATTSLSSASCATIKENPISGNMWVGQQTAPGIVQALNTLTGAVVANHQTDSNYVGEIAFDDSGNCFASHYDGSGSGNSRIVTELNSSGSVVRDFTYPSGKGNVIWPQPDHNGRLWVTSAGNTVSQFKVSNGAVNFTKNLTGAFCVAVDGNDNAYVGYGNNVQEYSSGGTTVRSYNAGGPVKYVALAPVSNDMWTANYTANTVTVFNTLTGLKTHSFTTVTRPWCVAFDQNGNPWVGSVQQGTNYVFRLDPNTGAIQAKYPVPGGGSAWEIAFDGNGDCWVSSDSGTFKLFSLGDLSDIFASDGFFATGDGDDSLGLMKFNVPANSYGGKIPIDSSLTLYAAATPPDGKPENLQLYRTQPNLDGSTTNWKGYKTASQVNQDYNNRSPLFDSFPYATLSNVVPLVGNSFPVTFNLGLRHPTDAINSSDASNSVWSYGVRSTGKALKNVVHWYSGTTAPATAQAPTLSVTLAGGATLPTTSGIACRPLVDSFTGHVYALASNCVFDLPYDGNPADFADPTKVVYDLTQAGRTGGPVSGGKYLFSVGTLAENYYGDIFVTDADASTSTVYANRFKAPFSATGENLSAQFSAGAGSGSIGQAMLLDYDKGSVYFTTPNKQVIRGSLY